MRDADCAHKRGFGRTQQLIGALFDNANWNSLRVISNPTLLNNPDVQFHDVAILNASLTTNTVDHFVIKRDANVPRENAMPQAITQKGTLYAGVAHEIRSRLIHF